MKKVLCLILSLVFIVGICVSAPVILTANAASVEDLTIIQPDEDDLVNLDYYYYYKTGSLVDGYSYKSQRMSSEMIYYSSSATPHVPKCIISCNKNAKGKLLFLGRAEVISERAFEDCVYLSYIDAQGICDIREYAFAGCSSLSSVVLPHFIKDDVTSYVSIAYIREGTFLNCSSLKTVVVPSQLEGIHKYAFKGCSSLEHFSFPENVTELGEAAFMGCTSLKDVVFNAKIKTISDYAFAECSSLESVVIPEGVTAIGAYAFSGCTSLKSITIPSTVKTIDPTAFYNCSSLEEIKIESNKYFCVDDNVLYNKNKTEIIKYPESKSDSIFIVPDTVECIGKLAFSWVKKLEVISIHEGVSVISEDSFDFCESINEFSVSGSNLNYSTSGKVLFDKEKTTIIKYCVGDGSASYSIPISVQIIGSNAFANALNLRTIKLPRGITTISKCAFANCNGLESVNIANTVTYIGENCFANCINLKTINLNEGIENISSNAFINCTALEEITIPASVTDFGSYAFSNCINLKKVSLSAGLVNIGVGVFKNCKNLSNINIPDSVTDLGKAAFYNCSSLETIRLSESLTVLNNSLFEKCISLKKLAIPLNVTSIGSNVFAECFALEEIIIPDKVESIGEKAFSKSNNMKSVTIPESVTKIASDAFEYCYSDLILFGVKGSYAETYANENSLIFIDKSVKVPSEFYRFELNEDEKSYSLISCDVSAMGQALIPLEYEGLPVTHITEDAFYNCKSIVSVTIPENIVSVGESSFLGCSSIQKLNIPSSVRTIEDNAFSQCTGIKTVKLVNGLEYIGNNAFSECSSIETITIPDSVKFIGENAFFMCSNLTEINVSSSKDEFSSEDGVLFNKDKTELIKYPEGKNGKEYIIPETVTDIAIGAFANSKLELVSLPSLLVEIKDSVFKNCCNIKKLTISANVTNIALNSFDGCDLLEVIEVEEGNENYTSIDGVLFNVDKNKLVKYPVNKIDKQYNIPSGVAEICKYAFNDCDNLESVNMPDTLKTIDDYAFLNCDLLYVMSVPKSVEKIGSFAIGYYDNDGIQRSELTIYGELESEAETYASMHNFEFKDVSEVYNVNIYVKNENQMLVTDPLYEIEIEEIVEPAEEYTTEYVASQSYEDKSFFGTGSKINIYDKNGNLVKQHIIVVKGDVNGDSVCDVLDCMLIELARNNNTTLEGAYLLAGDLAENGSITIEDFEAIVNRAIA